ncbi:TPA: hypothetical protein ACH3X2_003078 [Trebouxia sp. C0005]|nr:MAG: GTP-dependent nucleic acid-binding -like [Trebouxia sp. A1-2]
MSVPLQTTAGVCKAHLQSCSFGLSRRLFGKPHGRAYSTAASQTHKCLQQTAYLKSAFFAPLPTLQGHASGQQRHFRTSVVSMALKTGIVGMPNVGKSTLFNAICKNAKAQAANFPFCTIEPNVGIVAVPDDRLQVLSDISKSKKLVPTSIEFVDIAGLVKGASTGEGLGNKFLANIRECDSIVQVVRCFEDDDVHHVNGKVDPAEDAETINFELALADVAQIEKRLERLKKGRAKTKEEQASNEIEAAALGRIMTALDQNQPARSVELSPEEAAAVRPLYLLTMKPMVYAANVAEDDLADLGAANKHVQTMRKKAAGDSCELIIVSAQVEAELQELEEAEAKEYLQSLGVQEGGLRSLINATYKQLGLLTYFTTGEQETRAWTIKDGFTAPQAAGVIHTDFERGFIRAETVSYNQYTSTGGFGAAREKGVLRLEGKEYIVQEGDVMLFRFNV